jgi:Flp pilus assembly protein TadD
VPGAVSRAGTNDKQSSSFRDSCAETISEKKYVQHNSLATRRAIGFHSTVNLQSARQMKWVCHPLFICLLLVVATLAVYWPVKNYGFVNYDDSAYFFANPHVLGGLTGPDIHWAFTTNEQANWHPLTWLSLMLDAQLFGKGAMAPHLTNVLFHALNSILLYILLLRWTSSSWRSAAVAMLFAIHPVHVESVAWVAERKDVLSGFFGLLALLCYTCHARNNKAWSPVYWLTLFLFTCSLMAKPMLVTFPFLLLLLDYWPLQRFNTSAPGRLLVEKIPFLLISIASSVVTFIVQQKGGAVSTLTKVPLLVRVENMFVSYVSYVFKLFWPVNLANPYPSLHYWPVLLVIVCAALFFAFCAVALGMREKHPYVFTGWFWFAGTLVPVIGLVQVGAQTMADRYEYFPMIGILLIVVLGIGDLIAKYQFLRPMILCVVAFLFFACGLRARNQVSVWENDRTLFGHALAVTKNNYVASLNLGYWYSNQGKVKDALDLYHHALEMAPDDPTALYDVGNALARYHDWREAISDYQRALQLTPAQPDILNNLGFALAQNRQLADAAACFQAVLKLQPDSFDAHINLATMDFALGRYGDAAKQYEAALQLSPDNVQIMVYLGDALARSGQKIAAAGYYRQALQLQPDNQQIRAKLQSLGPINPD